MSGAALPSTPGTLVVLGATGTTGVHVLRQALEAGWSVRAVVRSAAKVPASVARHERLEVVELDYGDDDAMDAALSGASMVFIAVGYKGTPPHPVMLPLVQNVVRNLRRQSAKRLVYQASAMSPTPSQTNAAPVRLLRPVIGGILKTGALWSEHDAVIEYLASEVDDLEWTVTRAGMLKDGESRGTLAPSKKRGGGVTNRDLAAFSLDALRTGAYARTCPFLEYAPS